MKIICVYSSGWTLNCPDRGNNWIKYLVNFHSNLRLNWFRGGPFEWNLFDFPERPNEPSILAGYSLNPARAPFDTSRVKIIEENLKIFHSFIIFCLFVLFLANN
jgi:hypothetical protein